MGSFRLPGKQNRFSTAVEITMSGYKSVVKEKDSAAPIDQSHFFSTGDLTNYPFDNYFSSFNVYARTSNPNDLVPIQFVLSRAMQAFNIDTEGATSIPDAGTDIFMSITITRSFTTRFFSMFVFIVMWVLSLTIFILALSIWIRNRKVEPPTIGVTAGILFALPALRNAQPGAPVLGGTLDVAGFFWNVALVSGAAVLLMINYIAKYTGEHPEKAIDQSEFYQQEVAKQRLTVSSMPFAERDSRFRSWTRTRSFRRPESETRDSDGRSVDWCSLVDQYSHENPESRSKLGP